MCLSVAGGGGGGGAVQSGWSSLYNGQSRTERGEGRTATSD